MTDEANDKSGKPKTRRPGGPTASVEEVEEGSGEVKLSTVEKATGVVGGMTLFLAGVYAILNAAMWLIFESGRVITLTGWYGLLIPAALLATPMLALKWALSKRNRTRSSGKANTPKT